MTDQSNTDVDSPHSGIETLSTNNHYARLPAHFFHLQPPAGIANPRLVSVNKQVLSLLGLSDSAAQEDAFLQFCAGNKMPDFAHPLSMKYAGHQFGHFNPDLGDGRGLLLGQVKDPAVIGKTWDLHLKGAGKTPYSRQGDGRAVLRSSIREYLCSAAMQGLGVPTTQALSLAVGEEKVWREQLEPVATVVRVAESHIRFGHFEHFYYAQQWDDLQVLLDYTIEQHFSDLRLHAMPYLAFFKRVIKTTAELIAHWQCSGFVHGVMNTDNMSILGQTFDYGPFAFQDNFDREYVCNHTDHSGRYAYNQQPQIAYWNLMALGQALSPLIEVSDLNAALEEYEDIFLAKYRELMGGKLGLKIALPNDGKLMQELLGLLNENQIDFTHFFRQLSGFSRTDMHDNQPIIDTFINREGFTVWAGKYQIRLQQEQLTDAQRSMEMNKINPKFILRNYLAQQAINHAESGDYSVIEALVDVLANPFEEWPEYETYAALPPDWGQKMVLSCSS